MAGLIIEFLTPADVNGFMRGKVADELAHRVREAILRDAEARASAQKLLPPRETSVRQRAGWAPLFEAVRLLEISAMIYLKLAGQTKGRHVGEAYVRRAAILTGGARKLINALDRCGVTKPLQRHGAFSEESDIEAPRRDEIAPAFRIAARYENEALMIMHSAYGRMEPSYLLISTAEAIDHLESDMGNPISDALNGTVAFHNGRSVN